MASACPCGVVSMLEYTPVTMAWFSCLRMVRSVGSSLPPPSSLSRRSLALSGSNVLIRAAVVRLTTLIRSSSDGA